MLTPVCITALYEADKKAHEEAVQNGGVSFHYQASGAFHMNANSDLGISSIS